MDYYEKIEDNYDIECYLIDSDTKSKFDIKSIHIEKIRYSKSGVVGIIDIIEIIFLLDSSEVLDKFNNWVKYFNDFEMKDIYLYYPKTETVTYLKGCILDDIEYKLNKLKFNFIFLDYYKSNHIFVRDIVRNFKLNKLLN
jgi:hypothetical protein